MDNVVLSVRNRTYVFKVTYSFRGNFLNVEWGDVQGESLLLLALPHAKQRLLRALRVNATVAKKAIIITGHFLCDKLGILCLPIGLKCVLFQVTISENDANEFQKCVESKKFERILQEAFSDIEGYLKEVLGADFDKLEATSIGELKDVKITSVALCKDEEAERMLDGTEEFSKPTGVGNDIAVLSARILTKAIKVTYSFRDDYLKAEWGDVQGETQFLLALPQAKQRLLHALQASASLAKKAIIFTAEVARDKLRILLLPFGLKCVLFQVMVSENDVDTFQKCVESKNFERILQEAFSDVEGYLKEVLGADFEKLEASSIEELKDVKITSVALCKDEEVEGMLDGVEEFSKPTADETLDEFLSKLLPKMDEQFKIELHSRIQRLGITKPEHLRHLQDEEVASKLEGILKPVEIREIVDQATGQNRPLPPTNLRVSAFGYPNTGLTVFFDDPNKVACKYFIAAVDMETKKELVVGTDVNFGVLTKLAPGRRYAIFAQCQRGGQESKKAFFSEPITVYGEDIESQNRQDTFPTSDTTGISVSKSALKRTIDPITGAPSILDSAYKSTAPSVLTSGDSSLGEDALGSKSKSAHAPAKRRRMDGTPERDKAPTDDREGNSLAPETKVERDFPALWESSIHRSFDRIFPNMPESRMKKLLMKCEDIGLESEEDLRYLEKGDVVEELKNAIKTVEVEKLREYIKQGSFRRGGGIYVGESGGYPLTGRIPVGFPGNIAGFPGNLSGFPGNLFHGRVVTSAKKEDE